ncbi:hypothetical protein TNCV_2033841, partial [Trichonephila clavipes]
EKGIRTAADSGRSVWSRCLHLRHRLNERRYEKKDQSGNDGRRRSERREERGWRKKAGVEKVDTNPAVYLQVDDHVHPGNYLAAVSSEKTRPSSYGVLPSPAELGYERTDVVFSSFSDEWSRDLKSVQVLKQLSCRVGTLGTKDDEEVTAEMDKGSMVADSFRSNRSVVPVSIGLEVC